MSFGLREGNVGSINNRASRRNIFNCSRNYHSIRTMTLSDPRRCTTLLILALEIFDVVDSLACYSCIALNYRYLEKLKTRFLNLEENNYEDNHTPFKNL